MHVHLTIFKEMNEYVKVGKKASTRSSSLVKMQQRWCCASKGMMGDTAQSEIG